MKRLLRLFLVSVTFLASAAMAHASLVGPWFRYDCDDLGVQMLVASGWRMTKIPNGVVFAMQYQPQPYVRVAVGRVPLKGENSLETIIREESHQSLKKIKRIDCKIDGMDAVQLEGYGENGPFLDVFIKKATYCYWMGFTADRSDQWTNYRQTFDIIIDGFHFL